MEIIVDEQAGFCMGVRTAIETITSKLNEYPEIFIHGDIIHNQQVIVSLKKKGLKNYQSSKELPEQAIIAIRTHGLPYHEYKNLKNRSKKLINLCCPRVTRIQSIIKKANSNQYHVIIVGYANHPEVKSLESYAESGVSIITDSSQFSSIPSAIHYLLISQTTFDETLFLQITEAAKKLFKQKLTVHNTICSATHQRQERLHSLLASRPISKLIVIGGKSSSNTKRLAEIGKKFQIPTFHIETDHELHLINFNRDDCIAVTAGASTPDGIISDILLKLNTINSGFKI